jgi:hypothetical protein
MRDRPPVAGVRSRSAFRSPDSAGHDSGRHRECTPTILPVRACECDPACRPPLRRHSFALSRLPGNAGGRTESTGERATGHRYAMRGAIFTANSSAARHDLSRRGILAKDPPEPGICRARRLAPPRRRAAPAFVGGSPRPAATFSRRHGVGVAGEVAADRHVSEARHNNKSCGRPTLGSNREHLHVLPA